MRRAGTAASAGFLARLEDRKVTVGVVGLGYTGLPLAIASARSGFTTFGFDTDAEVCAGLNQGISHIEDVGSATVARMRAAGRFTAVCSGLRPVPEVIFLCVPTPFGQEPDLSYVETATATVARVLTPGMVVIAQSTSYPGTTTEVIQPLLEASGLRAGHDFALAFSPERIDPGNSAWNIYTTPRIIGGVTPESTRLAAAVLGAVLGNPALVRPVASPAVAEFAKLLENSYRLVNIGLVNELTMLAHRMGIDIGEVIDAAATKPYGFHAFRPGVGPGGACIPEDPLYLAWKARSLEFDTKLIDLAVQENQGMAHYVFCRLLAMMSTLGKGLAGSRVLCVGAGYKPGVADTRHSRSLRVMELLADAGAQVSYSDPLIPAVVVAGRQCKSVALDTAAPADWDLAVVLVADAGLDMDRFLTAGVPVFDAAHALTGPAAAQAERLLPTGGIDPVGLPGEADIYSILTVRYATLRTDLWKGVNGYQPFGDMSVEGQRLGSDGSVKTPPSRLRKPARSSGSRTGS
jgi:UDP-N-acetyl-D-glucosamine dehydrogenase